MVTTFAEAPRQAVKTAPSKPVLTVAPPKEEKKVAVITGASRGIGRATAMALADAGYNVAVCARGASVLEMPKLTRERVIAAQVDVRDYRALREFLNSVELAWGRIDVLVNNAGFVHEKKPVSIIKHTDFDPCFETNSIAPLTAIQYVLGTMIARGSGVIINVASKAARYASPGFAAYNMSKAALVSLTQTVAKEARGTGVRVYSVSPAGVNTEMRQKAHGDAEMQMSRDVVAQVIVDLTTPNAPESGSDIVVSKKGVEVHPMEEWYE